MRTLTPVPLTRAGFARYGDVISTTEGSGRSANEGTAARIDFMAALMSSRPGARANVAAVRSTPRALPFDLKLVERHLHSSQLFSPFSVSRYVVVCAPSRADGLPDLTRLEAFLAGPSQAINYHQGTWHHPLLVLDRAAEFLMLVWEDGTAKDCEEYPLQEHIRLVV